MPKFSCEEVGIDFLETAPYKIVTETTMEASCKEVFEILGDETLWPEWFDEMQKVTWTTPLPRAVGTQRVVELTSVRALEHFVVWEDDRRFAFRFVETNRPLFGAFMEDYLLEERGEDRCVLVWKAAWKPTLVTKLAAPIVQRQLRAMFERASRDLAAFVKKQKG
jgi:hypothetical protein